MRCVIHLKCLYTAVASTMILAGLSACDEGKIVGGYAADDPSGSGNSSADLTLTDAVQRQIFTARCVQCHGGSSQAAAGLYLTEGVSRQALVNRPSTVVDGATLVVPGNHDASLLWQAVASDISTEWRYNHSTLLTEADKYLLSTWIDLEN